MAAHVARASAVLAFHVLVAAGLDDVHAWDDQDTGYPTARPRRGLPDPLPGSIRRWQCAGWSRVSGVTRDGAGLVVAELGRAATGPGPWSRRPAPGGARSGPGTPAPADFGGPTVARRRLHASHAVRRTTSRDRGRRELRGPDPRRDLRGTADTTWVSQPTAAVPAPTMSTAATCSRLPPPAFRRCGEGRHGEGRCRRVGRHRHGPPPSETPATAACSRHSRRSLDSQPPASDGPTCGHLEVNVVIWCTGFRPDATPPAPTRAAHPRVASVLVGALGTQSLNEPRLHLVGYGDWTGPASATLIGVGRTARDTAAVILESLPSRGTGRASAATGPRQRL